MKRPKHVVDTVDTLCIICANTVVFWLINTHFMILYLISILDFLNALFKHKIMLWEAGHFAVIR